ncbi:hypothetical protein A2U01_0004581, partial [Trifolium medium]|nr:hypothetical protein [Trifolium medium]
VIWKWLPFKNSARKDDLQLYHWNYVSVDKNVNSVTFSTMQMSGKCERAKSIKVGNGCGSLLRVKDANYGGLAKNNVRVLVPTIVNVGPSLVVMSGFGQNLICSERMDSHGRRVIIVLGHVNGPENDKPPLVGQSGPNVEGGVVNGR